MIKRPKKDRGGGYNFMDTYGDMMTLLMTFFVLLFSFSQMDAEKFKLFQASFSEQTRTQLINPLEAKDIIDLESESLLPPEDNVKLNQEKASIEDKRKKQASMIDQIVQLEQQLKQSEEYQAVEAGFADMFSGVGDYIEGNDLQASLQVLHEGNEVTIQATDVLLFDSGKADLLPEAQQVLTDIGAILMQHLDSIELIRVEGHTDNRPINTYQFADNWDLSTKRATNALRALRLSGILEDKLTAVGYGESRPIATNDTPEGRAQNRRVCFVVVKKDVIGELVDAASAADGQEG